MVGLMELLSDCSESQRLIPVQLSYNVKLLFDSNDLRGIELSVVRLDDHLGNVSVSLELIVLGYPY